LVADRNVRAKALTYLEAKTPFEAKLFSKQKLLSKQNSSRSKNSDSSDMGRVLRQTLPEWVVGVGGCALRNGDCFVYEIASSKGERLGWSWM
jgi:hypothetical protein